MHDYGLPVQNFGGQGLTNFRSKHKNKDKSKHVDIIDESDRNILIEKAKRCLAWAHDPARTVVPGVEDMTKDQVRVKVRVRVRARLVL